MTSCRAAILYFLENKNAWNLLMEWIYCEIYFIILGYFLNWVHVLSCSSPPVAQALLVGFDRPLGIWCMYSHQGPESSSCLEHHANLKGSQHLDNLMLLACSNNWRSSCGIFSSLPGNRRRYAGEVWCATQLPWPPARAHKLKLVQIWMHGGDYGEQPAMVHAWPQELTLVCPCCLPYRKA